MDPDEIIKAGEYKQLFYRASREEFYKERNEFLNSLFGDEK